MECGPDQKRGSQAASRASDRGCDADPGRLRGDDRSAYARGSFPGAGDPSAAETDGGDPQDTCGNGRRGRPAARNSRRRRHRTGAERHGVPKLEGPDSTRPRTWAGYGGLTGCPTTSNARRNGFATKASSTAAEVAAQLDFNERVVRRLGRTATDARVERVIVPTEGRRRYWTLLTKVETSCDRILIAGGANVEAEWEQGPAV